MDASAERTLLGMAGAYQLSQALYVAAKLSVADALADGPLDAATLAERVGARPDELSRVLRALVASGVFVQTDDGQFALNDVAAALQADAPARTRDVVVNFGEEMYRSFGELLHAVTTGQPGMEAVFGQPIFEYYTSHPEAEASGSARMMARSLPVTRDLVASDVFAGAGTVVDVGGGIGTVVAALLQSHHELSAVLYERPPVAELAREYLSERGVLDRCEIMTGDFFTSVPDGGDLYVLKSVLHDWDDDRCLTILRNCRAAMHSDARLAIVDFVLPQRMTAEPSLVPGALLDLIMLTYAGGRERTEPEFRTLLDTAGLALRTLSPLASGPHIVEAVPQ